MYHGERFNSITHLLGAIAGLVGLIFLVMLAIKQGDIWKIISFSIYGATLFFYILFQRFITAGTGREKTFLECWIIRPFTYLSPAPIPHLPLLA